MRTKDRCKDEERDRQIESQAGRKREAELDRLKEEKHRKKIHR